MSERHYGPPWALPWDVNELRVNYRCLEAPTVYKDLEGYFDMPPVIVIRRVIPGLVSTPTSGIIPIQPRQLHAMLLPVLERFTVSDNLFSAPMYIHRFGVDTPRYSETRHV